MKQGKPVITVVMIALAAALAIYFGFYAVDTLNDPFTTTVVYAYTTSDSIKADGILVRQEQVFPQQGGIVDVTRGEGEKVGAGQTVALVYRDSQAQASQTELDALSQEITLLRHAMTDSGSMEYAARLDESILQSVVALRSSTALGNYAQLEEQVLDLKSNVLKRGYTYGDGLQSNELSVRLKELEGRYAALKQQTSQATTRVSAGQAGTFSAMVDGYESLLTPTTVFQQTPESLKTILASGGGAAGEGIGKLITGHRWYFAAVLPLDTAQRLKEGKTALLRFTGDFSQEVEMRVDQIGPEADGEALVVFSTDRHLAKTTLLRRQTAELIFDSWSGLRIPKEALRMEKYTYTETEVDEKTGEETRSEEKEVSLLGVYALVGGRVEFKTAEIVTEGKDFYVVRPTNTERDALRAGDVIIVRGTGLYDGQILSL